MLRRAIPLIIFCIAACLGAAGQKKATVIAPSYAWTMLPPLGLHESATIDTLLFDYSMESVPSAVSPAWVSTGNLGSPGINMILADRPAMSDFYFRDAIRHWIPMQGNHKFYNTRIPMTLVSYNTSGGRETAQDRLQADFSGNVNSRLQFGASVDYLYSKGSYANQADKNLAWGLSSSYMGDRYELQTFINHYNLVAKENGGITDDLYITNPEVLQGGSAKIDAKSIPTFLTGAHSRVTGSEFMANSRYKVGYWHVTPPNDSIPGDTIEHRTYIPVSSFIWTLDYNKARHVFDNTVPAAAEDFWHNTYLSDGYTHDNTSYWSLSNTLGVSLLEGFHKYAKAGLAAYVTHEIRRYNQTVDSIPLTGIDRPEGLTPYPFDSKLRPKVTENLLYVGGQLTKQSGRLLRYDVTGRLGIAGTAAGDVRVNANLSTLFRLKDDTVRINGYFNFSNEEAPLLMRQYVSNHFIWKNDFGKTRRVKAGGWLRIPLTGTYINAGVENIQNLIYFEPDCLPVQHKGSVQVVSVNLRQNFSYRALNWQNNITYQVTSDQAVLPAPKLAINSNLFVYFKVARVLEVQLGLGCDYYTRYYSPSYQPATMAFYNQREIEVGNYPFMNLYANMKLSRTRFYVMMSHINQGLTGKNYFAMPHYPMNPRRFQLGLSVDFAN